MASARRYTVPLRRSMANLREQLEEAEDSLEHHEAEGNEAEAIAWRSALEGIHQRYRAIVARVEAESAPTDWIDEEPIRNRIAAWIEGGGDYLAITSVLQIERPVLAAFLRGESVLTPRELAAARGLMRHTR